MYPNVTFWCVCIIYCMLLCILNLFVCCVRCTRYYTGTHKPHAFAHTRALKYQYHLYWRYQNVGECCKAQWAWVHQRIALYKSYLLLLYLWDIKMALVAAHLNFLLCWPCCRQNCWCLWQPSFTQHSSRTLYNNNNNNNNREGGGGEGVGVGERTWEI